MYLAIVCLSIGCGHAQIKPTSSQVDLNWTPPAASGSWAGCTSSSPCTYVVSRIAIASGTSACPAANVDAPNYTPLNTNTPASGNSFTDAAASGLTVCYVVQTLQGSAVSLPSNVAGPFIVPASPLAPAITGSPAVAQLMPKPQGFVGTPLLASLR